MESIGSSDKEGVGGSSSQKGSGSNSDKDGRLENVQKKRKLERLPEIVEEEEDYRKEKVWKEWWDCNKKEPEEVDGDGRIERNGDLSHKTREELMEELQEYWESIPKNAS